MGHKAYSYFTLLNIRRQPNVETIFPRALLSSKIPFFYSAFPDLIEMLHLSVDNLDPQTLH